ncbi:MAG: hypothetical protein Q9M91_04125 [Candidatus Dojkabacteria bacterium]|nr:hypothetical protein [Candidatus Dojkabacteria bacterium]MDQ7021001.1 hypothetical protein [Candidatus Dojkabacteria bacterium]
MSKADKIGSQEDLGSLRDFITVIKRTRLEYSLRGITIGSDAHHFRRNDVLDPLMTLAAIGAEDSDIVGMIALFVLSESSTNGATFIPHMLVDFTSHSGRINSQFSKFWSNQILDSGSIEDAEVLLALEFIKDAPVINKDEYFDKYRQESIQGEEIDTVKSFYERGDKTILGLMKH